MFMIWNKKDDEIVRTMFQKTTKKFVIRRPESNKLNGDFVYELPDSVDIKLLKYSIGRFVQFSKSKPLFWWPK